MTATRNDQKSLKSNLAEQGPSTHDSTVENALVRQPFEILIQGGDH